MKPEFDVVIVGSGAGGSACAWALAEAGIKVLVLEAGPEYNPEHDYRLSRPDWELQRFPGKPRSQGRYAFAPLQPIDPGMGHLMSWNHLRGRMNTGPRRLPYAYHHVRGIGGSTLHFTGEAHRLNPLSMRMKSRFGVAADWPFDYRELEPYYARAEQIVGVAGPDKEPTRPRNTPYSLPAHAQSYASRILGKGMSKLSINWTPNSLAVLSKAYDDRPPCNYCGNCNRGCPIRDKGSADVTFMRRARVTGRCHVLTECQVIRLNAGKSDRIASLEYADKENKRHAIDLGNKILVLACGAVETPRLLLASDNSHAPQGIANESGQVGKNFMETIAWTSAGIHPKAIGSHRGHPCDSISWDYNAPDAIPDVIGGCRFTPGTAEADLIGPVNYAERVVPGWGRQHKQRMKALFGKVLAISSIGESVPNPETFVALDPRRKDTLGMPLARIHSHLDGMALKRLTFMAKTARRILDAAGVEKIIEEYGSYDFFSSTHVFGTCRLGRDAEESVVNPNGRSHRWKNLYIADTSVFPSSGGGEAPSLTVEALALRTVEAMQKGGI
ncbi:MAG: GMC family oxidoreductase [Pseudomonadota bacterium]